ncbi:TetR/AcrR family transcriptional regulator [Microvirga brassicacearum]|uniref:TetR/AcrR family transcriptional regulator n=1 Tax=Microvirga brassicacearum TaxID=2580413 RepID=A0A5N3PBZ3_9HYPH|nr:TetR/AcrR family transcriptional regulator [Microvirga brassicacearum]KAB0267267.1 TetR/AcrR family transcriptional regulator [Microvirga brassicacearum]
MPREKSAITPHRSKGRPRTFDRAAALNRALDVFWRRGYEPASVAELCMAMEVNPPSLYAAFGNKAQLFMEAVHHYEKVYWDAAWQLLEEEPDLHRAMAGFFREAARILTSQDAPCGCMVVLGAANVSPDAQDVNDALKALRREGKDCFRHRLRKGVEDADLPSGTDVESLALTLNTVFEGMSVQARDGASQAELERIARTAMALLPARS